MMNQYQCGDDCKGECSGEVDGVVHCPYNPQAEREKVLDEFLHKERECSTTEDDTDCPYHRCVLCEIKEELRQQGKDGEP